MSILKINDIAKIEGTFKVISSEVPPPDTTPTYSLYRSPSATNEGTVVTYTLNTTNVAEGTLISYSVTGISQEDLSSGSLSGDFTVDAMGSASESFSIANDELTEGTETMTLSSAGQSLNVTINDTSIASSYVYSLLETEFNGTSDYITVPASPELALGTGNFTIEFWIKFTDAAQYLGQYRTLFAQNINNTCGLSVNRLKLNFNTSGLAFLWVNNTSSLFAGVRTKYGQATGINDNLWHHVAFTRRSDGVFASFLDGKYVTSMAQPTVNYNDSTSPYYIGSCTSTTGFYKGFLSDFRITKGAALYNFITANFTTQLFTPPVRTGSV